MASPAARQGVVDARRIVIKVGTRVLTHGTGSLALTRLFQVVEGAAEQQHQGREVLVVSSGAVGLGRDALEFEATPTGLSDRLACAAVGQSRLMALYQEGFAHLGLVTAQILLTQRDFSNRTSYLTLRSTLSSLLDHRVVPIINENDCVCTDELRILERGERSVFGDNDKLSALVASKLGADLLVLLTDVEGVYEQDPRTHTEARLIDTVDQPDRLAADLSGSSTGVGRGGMRSKVESALIASRSGCHVVIASGERPNVLQDVFAGANVGTWFPARGGMSARERWIAFATEVRGTIHLDAGAVEAITQRGGSVLAAGVTSISGTFANGDVVELVGPDGRSVGRGMMRVDAGTAKEWVAAGERQEGSRPLIRRDRLALEPVLGGEEP